MKDRGGEKEDIRKISAVARSSSPDRRDSFLTLAGLGGFLHLPLFGYDCHIEQAERQDHHHENECHGFTIVAQTHSAKITVVPAQ
jgi:hypothetical protein